MGKEWVRIEDECDRCGCSQVDVLTESIIDDTIYYGDKAKCPECELKGTVNFDSTNSVYEWTPYIDWDEFELETED